MEEGLTCYIVAGGPSLAEFDFLSLEGKDVITVNNAFRKVPTAKYVYFTDADWFAKWRDELLAHSGRKVRGTLPGEELKLDWVEEWTFTHERGLILEPFCLAHGFNSGCAAINLAVQLGYRTIYLLGYDMRIVDGRTNFHADHERTTPQEAYEKQFMPSFEALVEPLSALGISVLNMTPNSALRTFLIQHHRTVFEGLGSD